MEKINRIYCCNICHTISIKNNICKCASFLSKGFVEIFMYNDLNSSNKGYTSKILAILEKLVKKEILEKLITQETEWIKEINANLNSSTFGNKDMVKYYEI